MREIKFRAWHSNKMVHWGLFRNDDTYLLDAEVTIDEDENPVMQYTGLKDKNGKEIYEGDILAELKSYKTNNRLAWEMKWENDIGAYSLAPDFIGMNGMEIIGNIYENPELLES